MASVCLALGGLLLVAARVDWPSEPSSFPRYPDRVVSVLSGEWDFTFDASYDVTKSTAIGFSFESKQQVPGAWDAAWGTNLQYKRGTGAYRQTVQISARQPAALHFAACSMFCRVYVDGVLLANHTAGGYTPFWVSVPASEKEDRELVVVSSNIFSEDLTPTHRNYYDFYQYGGLIREVSLHVLPSDAPHIGPVEVTPLPGNTGAPDGRVDVCVRLLTPASEPVALGTPVQLTLTWDDAPAGSVYNVVADYNGTARLAGLQVPRHKVWDPSPETPRPLPLHRLKVAVGTNTASSDSSEVRFGLRTLATQGRDILVNGQPLKLKGVNRHDLYPNQGPVLTTEQLRGDLQVIQETLSGNFIRGSHYNQDDRFLDLCDELGVLVWSEGLGWGNSAGQMQDARFMRAQLETVDAMLDSSFNHPSIVLWGFFNEGQSDDVGTKPAYAAMAAAFRRRDRSRLITWASNRRESDLNLEHADVISFNDYPGWYGGDYTTIAEVWLKHASWVASNFPKHPFIISEGGAGGIVGKHSDAEPPTRWSLEYQSLADGLIARTAMNSSDIAGISLWQFADCKVDQSNTSSGRPGGINNKGVVDRWRSPKPAALEVAAAYAGEVQRVIV